MSINRLWRVEFENCNSGSSLPHLRRIASQRVSTTNYYYNTLYKKSKQYVLFQYTLKGKGCFRSGDITEEVKAGSGFLCFNSGTNVTYYYPENEVEPWEFIWVSFFYSFDAIKEIITKYGNIFYINPDSKIIQKLCSYKDVGTFQMLPDYEGFTLISELLYSIIHSVEIKSDLSRSELLVKKAIAVVFEDIEKDTRVSDIALNLDISKEHLCRIFKRETGSTLLNFIQRQRIYHACDLLGNTSLSLKEISHKLKYNTHSHFSRTFKKVMNTTPGNFRVSDKSQYY